MTRLNLPYAEAGLSSYEAAAFLLDRFAYGPRPGEVDRLVDMGLERWIEDQLTDPGPDPDLEARLADLDGHGRSFEDLSQHYVNNRGIRDLAQAAGILPQNTPIANTPETREVMRPWMEANDYHFIGALRPQLIERKVFRAVYSRHQLREVLTDFWFNHFNVDARGNNALYVFDYEETAIRAHVLGRFGDLLHATAHHPAMLTYLDNARSRVEPGVRTATGQIARRGGLNENYARELMDLHTLGVEGGYSQQDVEEVARAFTGWTFEAYSPRRNRRRSRLAGRAARRGQGLPPSEGAFVFRPEWHDAAPKTVLGQALPDGRGVEDGQDVLALLLAHPSTARFIATKLAIRFVQDDPDSRLIDRLAAEFTATAGDLAAVLRVLVQERAFWDAAAGPSKVKTPFEYIASALRVTDARVNRARPLAPRLAEMGEPVFHCEPPTGFPDHAAAWVNAGALLNRMSFSLHLALNQLPGIRVDLRGLNQNREPESAEDALHTYAALLLPGRDLGPTIDQLTPLVRDPDFATRVDTAARQSGRPAGGNMRRDDDDGVFADDDRPELNPDDMLAQVVGTILGSPQFHRQ